MTKITQLSLLKNGLVGKKITHRNRYGRTVTLEVEDVRVESGSRELDWWPAEESWTHYYLCFVDGSSIQFDPNTTLTIEE